MTYVATMGVVYILIGSETATGVCVYYCAFSLAEPSYFNPQRFIDFGMNRVEKYD